MSTPNNGLPLNTELSAVSEDSGVRLLADSDQQAGQAQAAAPPKTEEQPQATVPQQIDSELPIVSISETMESISEPDAAALSSSSAKIYPYHRMSRRFESAFSWSGSILNFMASVPEAVMGALFVHFYLRDEYPDGDKNFHASIALLASIPVGLSAYGFLAYFNQGNFSYLGYLIDQYARGRRYFNNMGRRLVYVRNLPIIAYQDRYPVKVATKNDEAVMVASLPQPSASNQVSSVQANLQPSAFQTMFINVDKIRYVKISLKEDAVSVNYQFPWFSNKDKSKFGWLKCCYPENDIDSKVKATIKKIKQASSHANELFKLSETLLALIKPSLREQVFNAITTIELFPGKHYAIIKFEEKSYAREAAACLNYLSLSDKVHHKNRLIEASVNSPQLISRITNTCLSLNIAGIFAFLAIFSFDGRVYGEDLEGLSQLFQKLNTRTGDSIADFLQSSTIIGFFAVPTLLAFMPAFWRINKRLARFVVECCYFLLEHPDYRQVRHTIERLLQGAYLRYVESATIYLQGYDTPDDLKQFLSQFDYKALKLFPENKNDLEQAERHLAMLRSLPIDNPQNLYQLLLREGMRLAALDKIKQSASVKHFIPNKCSLKNRMIIEGCALFSLVIVLASEWDIAHKAQKFDAYLSGSKDGSEFGELLSVLAMTSIAGLSVVGYDFVKVMANKLKMFFQRHFYSEVGFEGEPHKINLHCSEMKWTVTSKEYRWLLYTLLVSLSGMFVVMEREYIDSKSLFEAVLAGVAASSVNLLTYGGYLPALMNWWSEVWPARLYWHEERLSMMTNEVDAYWRMREKAYSWEYYNTMIGKVLKLTQDVTPLSRDELVELSSVVLQSEDPCLIDMKQDIQCLLSDQRHDVENPQATATLAEKFPPRYRQRIGYFKINVEKWVRLSTEVYDNPGNAVSWLAAALASQAHAMVRWGMVIKFFQLMGRDFDGYGPAGNSAMALIFAIPLFGLEFSEGNEGYHEATHYYQHSRLAGVLGHRSPSKEGETAAASGWAQLHSRKSALFLSVIGVGVDILLSYHHVSELLEGIAEGPRNAIATALALSAGYQFALIDAKTMLKTFDAGKVFEPEMNFIVGRVNEHNQLAVSGSLIKKSALMGGLLITILLANATAIAGAFSMFALSFDSNVELSKNAFLSMHFTPKAAEWFAFYPGLLFSSIYMLKDYLIHGKDLREFLLSKNWRKEQFWVTHFNGSWPYPPSALLLGLAVFGNGMVAYAAVDRFFGSAYVSSNRDHLWLAYGAFLLIRTFQAWLSEDIRLLKLEGFYSSVNSVTQFLLLRWPIGKFFPQYAKQLELDIEKVKEINKKAEKSKKKQIVENQSPDGEILTKLFLSQNNIGMDGLNATYVRVVIQFSAFVLCRLLIDTYLLRASDLPQGNQQWTSYVISGVVSTMAGAFFRYAQHRDRMDTQASQPSDQVMQACLVGDRPALRKAEKILELPALLKLGSWKLGLLSISELVLSVSLGVMAHQHAYHDLVETGSGKNDAEFVAAILGSLAAVSSGFMPHYVWYGLQKLTSSCKYISAMVDIEGDVSQKVAVSLQQTKVESGVGSNDLVAPSNNKQAMFAKKSDDRVVNEESRLLGQPNSGQATSGGHNFFPTMPCNLL